MVSSDCIECKASGGQNNNQYQQNDAAEQGQYAVCEELYSEAGKCEANMKDLPYKNNGACDYMHGTLARMNRDAKGYFVSVLKYAAWFLVAGALIFLGYKCYIRRRIINQASSRDALIPEKDLDEPLAGDSNKAAEIPAADADGQAAYQGGEIPSEEAPKENLTPATVV